jgi:hypothetical protein
MTKAIIMPLWPPSAPPMNMKSALSPPRRAAVFNPLDMVLILNPSPKRRVSPSLNYRTPCRIGADRPTSESYNNEVILECRRTMLTVATATLMSVSLSAQAGPTSGPRPFPGAPAPPPATSPRPPAPAPTAGPAPVTAPPAQPALASLETTLGVALFPAAELLETYDAGNGQKYFILGSNAAYTEVVLFYRTALKSGGREIYRAPAPAMQQFDLGRFQEDTMAYPPSVVVKDYGGSSAGGYLDVKGTNERRFKTIIQIVPAPPAPSR